VKPKVIMIMYKTHQEKLITYNPPIHSQTHNRMCQTHLVCHNFNFHLKFVGILFNITSRAP